MQTIKRILILGSGGREHVLAEAYSRNKKVEKVFVAPGNGLISFKNKKTTVLTDIPVNNIEKIIDFCKKNKIDLVDVAQDEPISLGFVDLIQKENILCFGPSRNASEVEWNKDWARHFMKKYNLPSPRFEVFSNEKKAISYIKKLEEQPLFIKASGLALGKGAIFAANKKEAVDAVLQMKSFGKAADTFLIEECMMGEEFSLFAICDGKDYVVIGAAQDHKTVFNKNKGPNTGGMGCVFPALAVDKKITREVETKIIKPFLNGMKKEKRLYIGVLYVGGMLTPQGVKIVEFNARWGDPEAEVIIPGIVTDYLSIVEVVLQGKLKTLKIKMDGETRMSIAGCGIGYPEDYSNIKGKKIFGLENILKMKGVSVYGAGIQKKDNDFIVSGGRVFHVVGEGKDIISAREKAYGAIAGVYIEGNNLHYRTDIGWRDVERLEKGGNIYGSRTK